MTIDFKVGCIHPYHLPFQIIISNYLNEKGKYNESERHGRAQQRTNHKTAHVLKCSVAVADCVGESYDEAGLSVLMERGQVEWEGMVARQEPADGQNGGCASALDHWAISQSGRGFCRWRQSLRWSTTASSGGLARPRSIQEKACGVGEHADRVLYASVSAGDPRRRQQCWRQSATRVQNCGDVPAGTRLEND